MREDLEQGGERLRGVMKNGRMKSKKARRFEGKGEN